VFGTTTRGSLQRTVWVLYSGHIWMSTQHRLPFRSSHAENDAAVRAQSYRDKVANGIASVLGREVIDGRKTLHLQEIIRPPAPQFPKGIPVPPGGRFPSFRNDAWVDPFTYLPVRTSFSAGSGGAVTDETWLPRTPANIGKTKIVIPPGFKHIVPNQGSGTTFSSSSVRLNSRCQS
jgi:hypothetical protein